MLRAASEQSDRSDLSRIVLCRKTQLDAGADIVGVDLSEGRRDGRTCEAGGQRDEPYQRRPYASVSLPGRWRKHVAAKQESRMHAVLFTLLLAASSPVATVSPTLPSPMRSAPAPATTPLRNDRARNLIGGVWQCETIGGSTGERTYSENEDDGSIDMQSELEAAGRVFRVSEHYRFDEARQIWTVQTEGGAYRGTAPPWNGYKWIFSGIESQNGQRLPVRMVYFDLGDEALRRDFQTLQDRVWRTYSAETCRRPSS